MLFQHHRNAAGDILRAAGKKPSGPASRIRFAVADVIRRGFVHAHADALRALSRYR
jgi:hypothetical protein